MSELKVIKFVAFFDQAGRSGDGLLKEDKFRVGVDRKEETEQKIKDLFR